MDLIQFVDRLFYGFIGFLCGGTFVLVMLEILLKFKK